MKKLLSLLLVLALCLSLFPAAALAEEPVGAGAPDGPSDDADEPVGADAPVGPSDDPDEPIGAGAPGDPEETTPPSSQGDDTSPYTGEAEIDPEEPVGAGVLDGPSDEPDALPEEPVADDLQAATASGECGDNLTWSLENGVLTISGTGAMTNWSDSSSVPWYSYRETITDIVLPEGLTSIGNWAFSDCKYVSSVTIPAGVTSIGNYAFYRCTSLTSVTIPEGVTSIGNGAFYECSSLTSVAIPEGVTSIGSSAFSGCSSLTSVTIPSSVTSIGDYAFSSCSNIQMVYIDNLDWWLGLSDTNGNALPHGDLYLNGEPVTEITVPAGTLGLRPYMFYKMTSLQRVTLPAGLRTISNASFSGCSNLTCVTISEGVTSIGNNAFYECTSLTSVTIPEGVTSIGNSAFSGCTSLTSVTISEGVTGIGNDAFRGCSRLTSVTIPAGVTSIGERAFYGCSGLKTVFFLGDAPSIDSNAFLYIRATALYPVDNETWTADKRQNYGASSLTWLGYRDVAAIYTVHFDPNDGSNAPADQLKGHGVDLTLTSAKPSRSNESAGSYTVSLDPNGGSVSSTSLTAARTTSYTFKNWNTAADGSGDSYAPGGSFAPNADTTLFAQWSSSVSTARISLPTPSRTGHNFRGWATDPEASSGMTGYYTPTEDITLYAIWTPCTYTVSFNANGGSGAPASQTKTYGVDLTLTDAIPTRTGYIFQGWATSQYSSTVSYQPGATYTNNGNQTLYAVWKAETYAVHFDLNGGDSGPSDLTKTYGQSLYLQGYAYREGHEFLGWARDPEATEPEFQPYDYYYDNEPVTLYAVWRVHVYPVQYIVGSKATNAPEAQEKTYNVDLVLSDKIPELEGYNFLGWSLYNNGAPEYQPGDTFTGNGNGATYGYEAPITFYAVWQAKTYLIYYKDNGGEDSPAPQIKTHGVALTLSEEIPTRKGYTFLGWATDRNATEAEYQPGDRFTGNADTVLYAVWEKVVPATESKIIVDGCSAGNGQEIQIPVRLEKNPGVVSIEISVLYDDTILEWTGVTEGSYGGTFLGEVGDSLTWYAEDAAVNETKDDVFVILSFRVKNSAPAGTTQVSVSYEEDDIYNADEVNQPFLIVPGEVEILSHIPGDINGDGQVNNKDVTRLQRYLKGQSVEVVEAALDVNGDGKINNKDATRLQRYLKYGDVDIH